MIGQVAGVQVQQLTGSPGGGTSVKIRGSGSLGAGNEPLYVVDGMPYSAGMNQNLNPLIFINPNDIESSHYFKRMHLPLPSTDHGGPMGLSSSLPKRQQQTAQK